MVWKAVAAVLFAVAAVAPAGAAQHAPSHEARQLHDWVVKAHDNHGRAFAIVDKKAAHIYVYDASGRLKGHSTALLGQAPGDDSAPGVGEHTQEGYVPVQERTTPAGRFVTERGENMSGESVIWVDYDAAFAIHRLRPGASKADRLRRLASSRPEEHRASYGCVVVPVRFYEDVVERWLGNGHAVVYVMPENGKFQELFAGM